MLQIQNNNHVYAKFLTSGTMIFSEQEHGFRKGQSCIGCIIAMVQLIEKHRELNIVTFIAFINHSPTLNRAGR
jgi:hypothetical protein